jgi:hypothetical protein
MNEINYRLDPENKIECTKKGTPHSCSNLGCNCSEGARCCQVAFGRSGGGPQVPTHSVSERVAELKARIKLLDLQLYVPPQGRMGGTCEKPLYEERARLKEILYYTFGETLE